MEKKLTRAEQRALEAYPVKMTPLVYQDLIDQFGGKTEIDVNTYPRCLFQQGYEQAEKNIKEWIEEQLTILDKRTLLHPDDDVFWGQRNAYKQMKDKLNSL